MPATELPVTFLASFLTAPGGRALAFAPDNVNVEHLRQEIITKISEESSSVRVYTRHWHSTGSVAALPQRKQRTLHNSTYAAAATVPSPAELGHQ